MNAPRSSAGACRGARMKSSIFPTSGIDRRIPARRPAAARQMTHRRGTASDRRAAPLDVVARTTAALHADDIEPSRRRAAPTASPNGMTSAATPLMPRDHGAVADPHELMHGRHAADETLSPTTTWPPSMALLAKIDVVADVAVMRDMAADHEQAAIADRRRRRRRPRCRYSSSRFRGCRSRAPMTSVVGPPR